MSFLSYLTPPGITFLLALTSSLPKIVFDLPRDQFIFIANGINSDVSHVQKWAWWSQNNHLALTKMFQRHNSQRSMFIAKNIFSRRHSKMFPTCAGSRRVSPTARLLVTARPTYAIISRQLARSTGRDGCIPACRGGDGACGEEQLIKHQRREVLLILMGWFTGAGNASRYRLREFRRPRRTSLAIKSVIICPFSTQARMSEITPKSWWEFSPWAHPSVLQRIPRAKILHHAFFAPHGVEAKNCLL